MTLTTRERAALASHWNMPIRIKGNHIEAKKGACWGILCTLSDGKKNAQIILSRIK